MFKKIFILFTIVFFQSSNLYSREFNYEVYGLNFNFLNIKLNMNDNKLYSIINSKGLAGYFIKSQSIILTTIDKEINSLSYYFNSLKKMRKKLIIIKRLIIKLM